MYVLGAAFWRVKSFYDRDSRDSHILEIYGRQNAMKNDDMRHGPSDEVETTVNEINIAISNQMTNDNKHLSLRLANTHDCLFILYIYTLPETNIAPENKPPQ